MKANLTIFATYWNEKDWIEASLAQIDALNPKEVWIVDGCFDTRFENRSTDGTREIIESWTNKHPNAHMISALRMSRTKGLWFLFGYGLNWWNWPLRVAMAMFYSRTNLYRINQACTFSQLIRVATYNKPSDWIMHCDADQFYPDEMIKKIKEILNNPTNEDELITAKEMTFFHDFNHYTDEYEKRDYNNMPYRLNKRTIIVPTRDIVTEKYPKPLVYGKDKNIKKVSVGTYMHYKFRPNDKERLEAGYSVGDRKKPSEEYNELTFNGEHPSIIQNHFTDAR
ncbi:MAG: hypothetical protein WDZ75_01495 [Candidatus Paceibacterota bacterium]